MSATVRQPGSNPVLSWYEARVTLNKGGIDKVYHCNFLCESLLDAQMRSVSMAEAEGAKFVSSECKLSEKFNTNRAGTQTAPSAASMATTPPPSPKPVWSAKEQRAANALIVVPINVEVSLYV